MDGPPTPNSLAPAEPFKYVGGDPSLDLINTVDWTARGLEQDRLSDYPRLVRWAEGSGLLSGREAARLLRMAAARPRDARAALTEARRVRWLLARLMPPIIGGVPGRGRVEAPLLREFNQLLGDALGRLRLVPPAARSRNGIALGWVDRDRNLRSPLWPVLRAAAELLAGPEAGRIRRCAGPDCGWMYVDRSRNGLRRWCEMQTCGTLEKSRRRRGRAE
jgi:predicted RNA-binding Zn ribbon-like protein